MTLEEYVTNGAIQSYVQSEAYLPLYDLNNKPSKLRIEYRVLIHFHTNKMNGQIEFTGKTKKEAEQLSLTFVEKM